MFPRPRTLLAALALPLLALAQSLSKGPGGSLNNPTFNQTLVTCETILFPVNITGIPYNVAAVTLNLVGDGRVPPSYNFDGDLFIPYNGTVIEQISFPSEFSSGVAQSGHYYLEVNEYSINCTTKATYTYTLQGQVNIVSNGFDPSKCDTASA
ncbi:hypothetical protein CALCODRAFT_492366 [Calocera cornea HHB12733]|uniref:Uncharacterized protein n=1 Tax=Calocera cornea HHB12733 TaxID=1353952 RepID=A0A165IH65_9BASI|nr:hypothetical protein CALCODRAFT_492366 [Calocera cornea HHB12733]